MHETRRILETVAHTTRNPGRAHLSLTEPPRFACWILEHCAPGHEDALAGDLLEELRAGRSERWYWHQVLSALANRWLHVLGTRGTMLLFTILWSSLAPAWTVFLDKAIPRPNPAEEFWRMDAAFGDLSSFRIWLASNLAFLWAGMLIYVLSHNSFARRFKRKDLLRGFIIAAPTFLLAYFGTFVAMNLLAYPGPTLPRFSMTPLGEIFDLRMSALALRVPFFVTLACALWEARPCSAFGVREPLAATAFEPASFEEHRMFGGKDGGRSQSELLRLLVLAGLVNASIAAVLLCRLPASHTPSLRLLLLRAVAYVGCGALAGTVGAWWYWRRAFGSLGSSLPLPFLHFALTCAVGWVWVPAVVLLAGQDAPAAAGVAALGAALLALGLRRALPLLDETPFSSVPEERELFADALRAPPSEGEGYAIASCIYLAGFALNAHETLVASGLLASAVYVYFWKATHAPAGAAQGRLGNAGAVRRLVRTAIPAALVTLWALLDGVAHRDRAGQRSAASAHVNTDRSEKGRRSDLSAALDGYESIVLWSKPPKKEIVAPLPLASVHDDVRLRKPLVIPFDGAYWYFQPPSQRPGPHAHIAHGSPLAVDIHSTTTLPLTMSAHENLARPLRLNCCGTIDVGIENRENRPGELALALVLIDNTARGKPSLYLGQHAIVSSQPDHFAEKSVAVHETLRFAIPTYAPLKRFDEMALVVMSDTGWMDRGARVAIVQFELEPR